MKTKLSLFFLAIMVSLTAVTAKPKALQDKRTQVVLHTTMGDIRIALYDETPQHKANFIKLVKTHYLDSLLFHRVIKQFMIQAGDPKSRYATEDTRLGDGDPGYTIPAEIMFPKLFHKRGAVAAARDNNPAKASSGSQFYIVWGQDFSTSDLESMISEIEKRSRGEVKFTEEVKNAYLKYGGTPFLDGSYTVFGEVIDGLKTVDKIQEVRTNSMTDRPFDDVRILSTEIIN